MSESTFANVMTEKMFGTPGPWSKRVVLMLLMSNGFVLGITCNKLIKVSSPIPFKIQLHLHHGRFTSYMPEFARSARTQGLSIRNINLLHCNSFIFNI